MSNKTLSRELFNSFKTAVGAFDDAAVYENRLRRELKEAEAEKEKAEEALKHLFEQFHEDLPAAVEYHGAIIRFEFDRDWQNRLLISREESPDALFMFEPKKSEGREV